MSKVLLSLDGSLTSIKKKRSQRVWDPRTPVSITPLGQYIHTIPLLE